MRTAHRMAAAACTVIVAAGGLTTAAQAGSGDGRPDSARHTTSVDRKPHCDASPWPNVWAHSDTVRVKGRVGKLYTEKIQDDEAYTAGSRLKKGDKISVERSKKTFNRPKGDKPGRPSHSDVKKKGIKKSCYAKVTERGQTTLETGSVWLSTSATRSYAVRSCVNPKGSAGKKCSRWFVDHRD